jgi:hypothetical protein
MLGYLSANLLSEVNQQQNVFNRKKICLLEWSSQSPDLNPFEMLWHGLKRAVHTRHPKNIAELKQFCKEEWTKIPPDRCAGLIFNYSKHLVEVIAAKVSTR